MNLPNLLTLLRILLTFAAIVLLCIGGKWIDVSAFVIYCVAGATDWFDGYLARKYGAITVCGKFMDALSDKIMVVSMFMTLFAFGMYGNWVLPALFCAIVSMSREFFVSGIRMLASNKGIVLAAEKLGKYKAAFQMYSIGAIICAYSIDHNFPNIVYFKMFAFYSGILTLLLSTVLSLCSGLSYAKRYSYLLKE